MLGCPGRLALDVGDVTQGKRPGERRRSGLWSGAVTCVLHESLHRVEPFSRRMAPELRSFPICHQAYVDAVAQAGDGAGVDRVEQGFGVLGRDCGRVARLDQVSWPADRAGGGWSAALGRRPVSAGDLPPSAIPMFRQE